MSQLSTELVSLICSNRERGEKGERERERERERVRGRGREGEGEGEGEGNGKCNNMDVRYFITRTQVYIVAISMSGFRVKPCFMHVYIAINTATHVQ